LIPTLLALVAVQTAAPADPAAEARFRDCATLARSNPEQAVEQANAWRLAGGGVLARQCLGLAYVTLERWAPAATVYEQAARDADAARDIRQADFWVQSGNAWLAAGEPTKAVLAFDSALALTVGLTDELRGEIHVDRARALVALNNLAGARQDLDRALDLVATDPFAWYLSAALARRQNDLVRARADVDRALQIAPTNADFLLLSGTLHGLAGNMVEAERIYRQVAQAAPESEAGRAARESLATENAVETPPPPATPRPQPTPQSR
jgi:tetratricopeptide (TPR) repeat protein